MERRGKLIAVKIVFAIIGTISGLTIFFSFIALKNINAAIWGLLSAFFAAIVLSLHIAYRKNVLLQRFPLITLRRLKHFGAFASLASIISAVAYFSMAVAMKQGYQLENDGFMPAGIFALLTLKWTAFLYFQSKNYEKIYTAPGETRPIANAECLEKPYSSTD